MNISYRTLSFVALALAHHLGAMAQDTKVYRDPTTKSSFSYPKKWEVKPSRTQQFRAVVGDKNPVGGSCRLSVRVNSELLNYSDQAALDATTAKDIEVGARSSGNPLTITKFDRTKVSNRPAIYYEAYGTYESLGIKFNLQVMAVIVKVQDRIYELGCSGGAEVMPAVSAQYFGVLGTLVVSP